MATAQPMSCACVVHCKLSTLFAKRGAEKALDSCEHRALCEHVRRTDWQPSHAASQGWIESHLPFRLASSGDANSNGEMYPDQSLYAVDSVPKVVKRINATFTRADQIQWSEGKTLATKTSWTILHP